jgi:hypothetical protein
MLRIIVKKNTVSKISEREALEKRRSPKGAAIIWIVSKITSRPIATNQDHRNPFQNPYAIMKKITVNTILSNSIKITKKSTDVEDFVKVAIFT